MVDVGGNDGAAARDLRAQKFRRDEIGNLRAKAFAVGAAFGGAGERNFAPQVFAMRAEDHFFRDDPGAGELELGHQRANSPARRAAGGQGWASASSETLPLSSAFTSRP